MRMLYQINQPNLTTSTRQQGEPFTGKPESKKAASTGGPDTWIPRRYIQCQPRLALRCALQPFISRR